MHFPEIYFLSELFYSLIFLFGMLVFIHGMQVLYLVMKDAEKLPDIAEVLEKIRAEEKADKLTDVLNHRKLYKALKRLDDIENC